MSQQYALKVTLKGMYENEHLHGLNSTATSPVESEKENLVLHTVRCLEEQFLNWGNSEWLTSVFDTSVWSADCSIAHFKKHFPPPKRNGDSAISV